MNASDFERLLNWLVQRSAPTMNADQLAAVAVVRALFRTQPEADLSKLTFKKAAKSSARPKVDKPLSAEAMKIHASILALYDSPTLVGTADANLRSEVNRICSPAKGPALKQAASRFLGPGMSKLKKDEIEQKIFSKIATKQSNLR